MKRRRIIRRGDLRLVAAVLATVAFAVLLNQPSRSLNEPTWLDTTVLRLNRPSDAPTLDAFALGKITSDSDSVDVALPTALPWRHANEGPAARFASSDVDYRLPNSGMDSPIFKNP